MNSAFVTPIPPLGSAALLRGASVCASRSQSTAVVRMGLNSEKKRAFSRPLNADSEGRRAKKGAEYRGPQGFTPYAERVNGRIAQLGFAIGLVTEIVSGKPIGEQILIMFSPLVHAASELFVVSANAAQHLLQ